MAKQRFTRRTRLNKSNARETSADKPAIYKLLNSSGDNIYTGVAKRGRLPKRLAEHLPGGSDPIPGAASYSYKPKKTIGGATTEERRIIRAEQPKHNDQHK